MSYEPAHCPLCGQANNCQLVASAPCEGSCWCTRETFSPAQLARVPEAAREVACLCRRCITSALLLPADEASAPVSMGERVTLRVLSRQESRDADA